MDLPGSASRSIAATGTASKPLAGLTAALCAVARPEAPMPVPAAAGCGGGPCSPRWGPEVDDGQTAHGPCHSVVARALCARPLRGRFPMDSDRVLFRRRPPLPQAGSRKMRMRL